MNNWPMRLRALQEKLGKSSDEMAELLGLTQRSYGEFARPEGRIPGRPTQRRIEQLENQLLDESQVQQDNSKELNLVIIHSGFSYKNGEQEQDVVTMIEEMNKAAGNSRYEFHYIDLDFGSEKSRSLLQHKQVKGHFPVSYPGLPDGIEVKASYFATTATLLVSRAKRGNRLGHVTLAASAKDYWPIALEIKSSEEVDVSFIKDAGTELTPDEETAIHQLEINILDQNRYHGRVIRTENVFDPTSGFGFLKYVKQDTQTGKWVDQQDKLRNNVFFSWNHMRKRKSSTEAETPISELREGDIVSFSLGMNHNGACAVDVTLICKLDVPVASDDLGLVADAISAISDCPREDGWALIATVGTRLSVQRKDYKQSLSNLGYEGKLIKLFEKHKERFDVSPNGNGTPYNAACVRMKGSV